MPLQPTDIINSLGYLGIFLLIFLFPVPPEIVLPLAGFMSAQGKFNLFYVVVAGVMGSTIAALPWYYAGKYIGERRLHTWARQHGRWLKLSTKDLQKATQWFDQYGQKALLCSQFFPGIRTLIALPAGISHMSLGLFLPALILSAILWQGTLACIGYFLGDHYRLINQYASPWFRLLVLLSLVVAGGLWLAKRSRSRED